MKEHPILYSTPMIVAKLEGRKTQTRRIMKVQPDKDCYFEMKLLKKVGGGLACMIDYNQGDENPIVKCPYGKVGDILWARETFIQTPFGKVHYRADITEDQEAVRIANVHASNVWAKWKPSIFQPKGFARIWERITDIHVERLQDISEEDAIAEGVYMEAEEINGGIHYKETAVEAYKKLWGSINGPGSWELNPWVWVVESEILSTTGRPKEL